MCTVICFGGGGLSLISHPTVKLQGDVCTLHSISPHYACCTYIVRHHYYVQEEITDQSGPALYPKDDFSGEDFPAVDSSFRPMDFVIPELTVS